MDKVVGMREEWNKMISDMHRVDRIMRQIAVDETKEVKKEWDNMMNSVTKIQNLMEEKKKQ